MDALSDVLRVARLSGGVFLHARFTAPWCLSSRIPPDLCAPFLDSQSQLIPYHYVLEGVLRARLEDGIEHELRSGEVVLFPRNDPHLLGSDLTMPPVSGADVVRTGIDGRLASIRHGGGGAPTRIVSDTSAAKRWRAIPCCARCHRCFASTRGTAPRQSGSGARSDSRQGKWKRSGSDRVPC